MSKLQSGIPFKTLAGQTAFFDPQAKDTKKWSAPGKPVIGPFDDLFLAGGRWVRRTGNFLLQMVQGLQILGNELSGQDAADWFVARSLPLPDELASFIESLNSSPKKKTNRGAPVSNDPKADKRLCENWQAAKRKGASREVFARDKGIKVNDLIAAQDRVRYVRVRDAE